VVCVEEGWPQCGIASEVAAIIMESDAFDYLDAPFQRITGWLLYLLNIFKSKACTLADIRSFSIFSSILSFI
jgi:pyruvate/2-oxoglutarate/acetoin dehydrogenase E1 component